MKTEEAKPPFDIKLVTHFGVAVFMVIVFWVFFIIEQNSDYRFLEKGSYEGRGPMEIIWPAIGSVVILVVAAFMWLRLKGIEANGVYVPAKVLKTGMARSGMQDVTISYSYLGADYTSKKSLDKTVASQLKTGMEFPLLVDKRKPKRFVVEDLEIEALLAEFESINEWVKELNAKLAN